MANPSNVGVLGLGIIGANVAENLRRKGFGVVAWNRSRKDLPGVVSSPVEVAERADTLQVFVSNDAAVLETVAALKPALTARHLLLIHSTISPETARRVQAELAESGTRVVDAPFTGSRTAAEKGELVYYLAGDAADLERAHPVLQASSKGTVPFGRFGDASTVKIATNLISAAIVQALAEALAVTEKAGIEPQQLAAAVAMNACRSGVGDLKLPTMLAREYPAHFSLKNMLKDSRLALALGEAAGLDLPVTRAVGAALAAGEAAGLADQDYAAVAEMLRR